MTRNAVVRHHASDASAASAGRGTTSHENKVLRKVERAGVITYGKNSFAYCGHGSFIIVVNIVTDADLVCGVCESKRPCPDSCRLCIDACPTHAVDDEGGLDPMRCILYSNMFPGAILDKGVRPLLGQHIHGCDECQPVCLRNRHALGRDDKHQDALMEEVAETFTLEKVPTYGEETFNAWLGRVVSPYFKDYARHQRNAAIAMGNSSNAAYLDVLRETAAATADGEARGACEWAIGQLGG